MFSRERQTVEVKKRWTSKSRNSKSLTLMMMMKSRKRLKQKYEEMKKILEIRPNGQTLDGTINCHQALRIQGNGTYLRLEPTLCRVPMLAKNNDKFWKWIQKNIQLHNFLQIPRWQNCLNRIAQFFVEKVTPESGKSHKRYIDYSIHSDTMTSQDLCNEGQYNFGFNK